MHRYFSSSSERKKVYRIRESRIYRERQKRQKRTYHSLNQSYPNFYKAYSQRFYSELTRLLLQLQFIDEDLVTDTIIAPRDFTFQNGHEKSIRFIKRVASTIVFSKKRIHIDFQRCRNINIGPAMVLQILILENEEFREKYNEKSHSKIPLKISISAAKSKNVNRMLFALKLINKPDTKYFDESGAYLPLDINVGSKYRKSYFENKKGSVCQNITKFINASISGINLELNSDGIHFFERLISEVLGNAEDHSKINRWFVNGVSFLQEEQGDNVVQFNLGIVNFGNSIYEGFEESKEENFEIYNKMENVYSYVLKENGVSPSQSSNYSKECLFTLYALQEGISRLKYKEESRGNGTMNFLQAFIELGSVGSGNPKNISKLNIFSGNTSLTCDNRHKPELIGKTRIMALNDSNDLKVLPDSRFLYQEKEHFPGTIIQIKLFLNQRFFIRLIQGNE